MINRNLIWLAICVVICAGCSDEQLKSATYSALQNQDCIKTHGYPDCHTDQPDYEEYKQQREDSLKE